MQRVRITSGFLRGRSIKTPGSDLVHPMGSREKLALFNMITSHLADAVVLDAFAGSGALGIEALSQGAKRAIFLEKNPKVAKIIAENLKSLNLSEKSQICLSPVRKFQSEEKFDLIIADPPYKSYDLEDIFHLTIFLKDGGVMVLSHPTPDVGLPGFTLTKTKKYAKAWISIYQK